ncbi:MAG: 1-deoxy-D-xylulose-5-phosphate synthase [Chlamydiae bacterium]|nr:1-deoxy-D-xylulose-5-phosphate synthase [Chlamydiota bacterium]
MSILPKIRDPADLKNLSLDQLKSLSKEIRQKIIDVMAINGGHLGSNMGIVELSIALHRTFHSPDDRFIFDVSHQTYPHKLLTGRQDQFPTIRQYKGLSGFAHPEESPHDHFFAGHAGTALSLGLGVAKARDLQESAFHVIPIIGDATFTCGLSLEALNNIPQDLKRFIIVLNDNNMSISNNVGAITKILDQKAKLCAPFFEQYGLQYIGPIDGHDLPELLKVFESLKNCEKPTILHVLTVKGKGLEIAEQNPIPWHGCAPFDKVTGEKVAKASSKPKFPQIFGKHLLKMAEKDPSIVTVTPAMPHGSCIAPLLEKFPERSIDVGIAEGHSVTYCGGIASDPNRKVVCSIYSTFLQRAFDNLFQDVCLQKLPVLFALDRSGIATGDGATHHGIYDISFLNAMPNMVICQPRNGHVLKELLESAFAWKRPTAIRYPNMGTEEPDLPIQKRKLGKGEILEKGTDVALIALGHMCSIALDVRALLAQEGISATVVDPIFVKPLDTELLTNVFMSHKYVATIEEHAVNSGLGVLINTFCVRNGFSDVEMHNFGIPETFLHQGGHKEMLASIGLDPESIAAQILKDYAEGKYDYCDLSP